MDDDDKNLLAETLAELVTHGKTPADVRWVGRTSPTYQTGPAGWVAWEEFAAVADFTYDAGFGGPEIDENLLVVGADWWLERGEYDGSEWWAFKALPARPAQRLEALDPKAH